MNSPYAAWSSAKPSDWKTPTTMPWTVPFSGLLLAGGGRGRELDAALDVLVACVLEEELRVGASDGGVKLLGERDEAVLVFVLADGLTTIVTDCCRRW